MRIRVATLNVWALPEPLARSVEPRMRAIGARLASLDLDAIAFQEVWTEGARTRLVAAGRAAGLAHAWHPPYAFGGGLLVLTRLPIRSARFDAFAVRGDPARPDHPDYYGGKGWATLELETRVGPLLLVDTHLHAPYRSDVAHAYRAQRVGQITELALASRQLPQPVVMLGDFKLRDDHPEHTILTGLTGMRDVAGELGTPVPTVLRSNPYRANSSKPDRRVDYVFVRDGSRDGLLPVRTERLFDERFEIGGAPASYSNHAGVLAELQLVAGAGQELTAASPHAVSLARRFLREGRQQVEQRRQGDRVLAGAGLGAAALASLGVRDPRVSRRRLLRTALQVGAVLALTPGVGFSIVSEVLTPAEEAAFDRLAAQLANLRASPGSWESWASA
jgi:endonuclease/exonuclease/phosphatase family metal-dependent hydrolase